MMVDRARALGALALCALAACNAGTDAPVAAMVDISAPSTMASLGDTLQLTATGLDANGAALVGAQVSWRSSDTTVLQVDAGGAVRAVGEGSEWIIATVARREDSLAITVGLRRIGDVAFTSVDAGASHACMLTSDNLVYCVGKNGSGELGDGTQTSSNVPVLVGVGEGVTRLSAGDRHTCALGASETMYCWGLNSFAQLGTGSTSDPVLTPHVAGGTMQFVRLVASDHLYTCGLLGNGAAFCWGHNDNSQVGRAPAVRIDSIIGPVSGTQSFAEIDAGSFHSCALATDGAAYCWGYAGAGALGNGAASETRIATPTAVTGTLHFSAIGTGVSHTCAVALSGEVYCWGSNDGKLGIGPPDGLPKPTPMRATPSGTAFVSVTAGIDHTCALTTQGKAYCWGLNTRGQLGNFWMKESITPMPFASTLTFRSLSAGRYSTCGVTISGALYCWPATFVP